MQASLPSCCAAWLGGSSSARLQLLCSLPSDPCSDTLNQNIVSSIQSAAMNWGLEVLRYEIRDILPPARCAMTGSEAGSGASNSSS